MKQRPDIELMQNGDSWSITVGGVVAFIASDNRIVYISEDGGNTFRMPKTNEQFYHEQLFPDRLVHIQRWD